MKLGMKVTLAIFALSAWAAPVRASAPNTLTYQGRLLENGVPASGSRGTKFRVCDDASGVSCSGPIILDPITVTNGLYRVEFPCPVDLSNGVRFLEVSVGPTAGPYQLLLPREQLTSTPYAMYSSTAGMAQSAQSASSLVPGPTTSAGAFISTHVIIGNNSDLGIGLPPNVGPKERLDIQKGGTTAISLTSFGGVPSIKARRANGTQGGPTGIVLSDTLGELEFGGFFGGNFNPGVKLRSDASENWAAGARGSGLTFMTVQNGGTVPLDRMYLTHDGGLGVGIVPAGAGARLQVNGPLETSGQVKFSGGAPTVVGTGCGVVAGSDTAGIITISAPAVSCKLVFNAPRSIQPACVAGIDNGASGVRVSAFTPAPSPDLNGSITLAGSFSGGDKISYICLGY